MPPVLSGGSGGGGGGSGKHYFCFVGESGVLTPDREYVSIEEIEVGDRVVSYDTETGEYTTSVVGETLLHDDQSEHNYDKYPLATLTVVGEEGKLTQTEVTSNHKYYSETHGS